MKLALATVTTWEFADVKGLELTTRMRERKLKNYVYFKLINIQCNRI